MKGNNIIDKGTVLVGDGRIIAVGATEELPIPPGAKVYTLDGKTIMPGLIDLHFHDDDRTNPISKSTWIPHINLAYGVTTQRNPGSSNLLSFGWSELIETGAIIGPRLYVAYRGITSAFPINGIEDAQAIVQQRKAMGGVIIKQYVQPDRLKKQLLQIASRQAGMNLTNEGQGPLEAISMIKDGSTGIEHGCGWGTLYKDYFLLFKKSGVYWTPTTQTSISDNSVDWAKGYFRHSYFNKPIQKFDWFAPKGMREQCLKEEVRDTFLFLKDVQNFARVRKNGGNVTVGSHGEDQGVGTHFDLWALQMGGLTNLEALQASTILAAKALGMQKDIGSIEVGKIADLIVLENNPLVDIHNTASIRYVMKDGILYNGDTLNTLWPTTQNLSPEKAFRVN
jgi:hypothetical protein